MKNYRITVNGNMYDVQVEEVVGNDIARQIPPVAYTPVAPVAQAPVAPMQAQQTTQDNGKGEKVKSPMPGNILDIKVAVGDKVSVNQVVVILEAMKMENEIVTPVSGTVTGISVTKGQTVASDDILITIA